MARPSKSIENTSGHRTKVEKRQRGEAEKAALTGFEIHESAEVMADKVAHAEFQRVVKLLSAVGKNDALYEAVINDYCMYKSGIARYTDMRQRIENDESMGGATQYKLIMECDKQADAYRKKRFDIEKENGFTIASALRSIPKKVEKDSNPLLRALQDGDE